LKNAKFQGANLRGSDFTGSLLADVHFKMADLRDCIGISWDDPYGSDVYNSAKVTQKQFNEITNPKKVTFNLIICE